MILQKRSSRAIACAFLVLAMNPRRVHHRPRRPLNLCLGDLEPIPETKIGSGSTLTSSRNVWFFSSAARYACQGKICQEHTRNISRTCPEHVQNMSRTYQELPLNCVVEPVSKRWIYVYEVEMISIAPRAIELPYRLWQITTTVLSHLRFRVPLVGKEAVFEYGEHIFRAIITASS